jgi:hypothetical protein
MFNRKENKKFHNRISKQYIKQDTDNQFVAIAQKTKDQQNR